MLSARRLKLNKREKNYLGTVKPRWPKGHGNGHGFLEDAGSNPGRRRKVFGYN